MYFKMYQRYIEKNIIEKIGLLQIQIQFCLKLLGIYNKLKLK